MTKLDFLYENVTKIVTKIVPNGPIDDTQHWFR